MKLLGFIFTLLVALLVVSFTASNQDVVSLGLFPFVMRIEMPLVLLLYVTLLVGVVLGFFVSMVAGLLARLKNRHKNKT